MGVNSSSLLASDAECGKGRTAPRVSLADIEAAIAAEYVFTADQAIGADVPVATSMRLLTICVLVTSSGYTVVGTSAPASAANFDAELGAKLARENAVRQLWPLMGFALRERLIAEAYAA